MDEASSQAETIRAQNQAPDATKSQASALIEGTAILSQQPDFLRMQIMAGG